MTMLLLRKETQRKCREKQVNILDLNRARMVGIVLARFQRRLSFDDIYRAVSEHDSNTLSLDDLLALKSIFPTSQERSDLLLFKKRSTPEEMSKLQAPERFFLILMEEPNIDFMLDSFIYRLQFQVDLDALKQSLVDIKRGCDFICQDSDLKLVLGAVLQLGNMVNYEYGVRSKHIESQAAGFKLDTLPKLKDVKSRDGRSNLLSYLVDNLLEANPHLAELPDKFSLIHSLRHVNSDDIVVKLHNLRSKLVHMKNFKPTNEDQTDSFKKFNEQQLLPFLESADTCLKGVESIYHDLLESWKKTAAYFGEDLKEHQTTSQFPLSKRPEEIFIVLDTFFQLFDDAIAACNRAKKARERQAKQSSQAPRTLNVNPPSIASVRDQMLEQIRNFKDKSALQTEIRSQSAQDETEDCPDCGLPLERCDCTF